MDEPQIKDEIEFATEAQIEEILIIKTEKEDDYTIENEAAEEYYEEAKDSPIKEEIVDPTEEEIRQQELENGQMDTKFDYINDLDEEQEFDEDYYNKLQVKLEIKENEEIEIQDDDSSGTTITCGPCSIKFTSRAKYLIHLKSHNHRKKLECPDCPYRTKGRMHLVIHMSKHHGKNDLNVDEFKLKCLLCHFTTFYKGSLEEHLKTHTNSGKNIFNCKVCGLVLYDKYAYKKHFYDHKGKEVPRHHCEYCGFITSKKSALKVHVESVHLKLGLFKCPKCEYRTSRKGDLKIHFDFKHEKQRNFKCEFCDYEGFSKSHLTRHMKRHLEPNRFKCEECQIVFEKRILLTTHNKKVHNIFAKGL